MPIEDIIQRVLSRTLPEEGELLRTPPIIEETRIKPIRSVSEPPSLEEDVYNTHQRALGLDQKYNEDGTPRKKNWKEKLGAAAAIAMAGAGEFSRGARRNPKEPSFSEQVEDQVMKRRDAGMKERIAKMQTDQRREASELAAEMKLAGIESTGNLKQQEIAIKAAKARGEISESQANAALLRVKAKQIEGITEGTSAEGKSKLGLTQSIINKNKATADDLRNTPNQSLEQALVAATKSGDTAQASQIQSMIDRMARLKLAGKPVGSESTQQYNDRGQLVTKRSTLFGGVPETPETSMNPPSGGIAPKPSDLPSPDMLNRQYPPQLSQPGGPLSVPEQAAPQKRKFDWNPLGKARNMNPAEGKKYNEKVEDLKEDVSAALNFANQNIDAYSSGDLEKFSGAAGTLPGIIYRNLKQEGISPKEASLQRAQTAMTAAIAKADQGSRPSDFDMRNEISSAAKGYSSAKSKVAYAIASNYDRLVKAWDRGGDDEQKAMAREIVTDPKRRQELSKSIAAYIRTLDLAKNSKLEPPPMSNDLYILSRTDEELQKMFGTDPKKPEQLTILRATGGEAKLPLRKNGAPKPAMTKTKNDNDKLNY